MLTPEVLESYLREMPRGHIFDLPYDLFAAVLPPGADDPAAWAALKALAESCDFVVKDFTDEQRIELIKRE